MTLPRSIRLAVTLGLVCAHALAGIAQTTPSTVGVFDGSFGGSYKVPENDLDVKVTVTLKRGEERVQIRWTETVTTGSEPPATSSYEFLGVVRGPQLRFSTPAKSLFPGITYTAVRMGPDLIVHLRLFSHPTGIFTDQACEACEEVVKEVKMIRR